MTGPKFYRRRPTLPVEAMQWSGSNADEVAAWVGQIPSHVGDFAGFSVPDGFGLPEGKLWVQKAGALASIELGSWIVREPDGEGFYPVTRAIFANSYEEHPE